MTMKPNNAQKLEQFQSTLEILKTKKRNVEEYIKQNDIRVKITNTNILSKQQLVPPIENDLDCDIVFEVGFSIRKRFWIFFMTDLLVICRLYFDKDTLIKVDYITYEREPL